MEMEYWGLWLLTNCVDYSLLIWHLYYVQWTLEGRTSIDQFTTPEIFWVNAKGFLMMQCTFYARERLYFSVFGQRIAKVKRDYTLTWRNFYFVCQTMITTYLSVNLGILSQIIVPQFISVFSAKYWLTILGEFYALQILKDVIFLIPLHERMHESKWWYQFHKTHHEVGKNAQFFMAYNIDLIDLFIENAGAPVLYWIAQWLLGYKVGVSVGAYILLVWLDAGIHSVNPYTVLLFNPILDAIFKCNVAHQLHHSKNLDHYTFLPYCHIWPSCRSRDVKEYNKIFETTFPFW